MALAPARASRERSVERPLSEASLRSIEDEAWTLGNEASAELLDEGIEHGDIALTTRLHLAYAGTDTAIAPGHRVAD